MTENSFSSAEEKIGFDILLKALEAPLKQIAMNVGKEDGAVIVDKIKNPYETKDFKKDTTVPTVEAKKKKENFGFNALKNAFEEDMIKNF